MSAMTTHTPCRVVVLISGSGSNLQAIIDAVAAQSLPAEIVCVMSNRPAAGGLQRAQKAGIPTDVLDHTDYAERRDYDAALIERIDPLKPDLIVLAGFMRILTDEFVRHYWGRLVNIHPSLLPAYRGLNTHARALADRQSHHGCSVHYVIPALDAGPVIAQAQVAIAPNETAEQLQQRVQHREHQLYPEVIRWIAQGRVALIDKQVMLDGKPLLSPVQLPDPHG